MARARLHYQDPAACMTLGEGLEELRSSRPELVHEADVSPAAAELFHNHDLVHVMFGCDTSLEQETMADIWTIFGTDVGLKGYLSYVRLPEVRRVIMEPGIFNNVKTAVLVSPRLLRVAHRARAMKKKWPFHEGDAYLHRPLDALRREFGVRVL